MSIWNREEKIKTCCLNKDYNIYWSSIWLYFIWYRLSAIYKAYSLKSYRTCLRLFQSIVLNGSWLNTCVKHYDISNLVFLKLSCFKTVKDILTRFSTKKLFQSSKKLFAVKSLIFNVSLLVGLRLGDSCIYQLLSINHLLVPWLI